MTINQELIDRLRQLPVRAQQNIKTKVHAELGPDLEKMSNNLMKDGPLPVSDPFVFGSNPDAAKRSHDAYMAILRNMGIKPQNGLHWERTGEIEQSWRTLVGENLAIVVLNVHPNAKWVYGPWAVPGHLATGWLNQAIVARQQLRQETYARLHHMWRQSVHEAAQGKG